MRDSVPNWENDLGSGAQSSRMPASPAVRPIGNKNVRTWGNGPLLLDGARGDFRASQSLTLGQAGEEEEEMKSSPDDCRRGGPCMYG